MYKYSKVLVGLDNTDTDNDLIKATAEISKISGSKEIYFVNIIRDFNIPEKIQKEFPQLLDNAIKERKKEIQKRVETHFGNNEETKIHIDVQQGQVTKVLLKFSAKAKIDLIVLGRKNEKKSEGVLVSRIARRAACSLLIIPKNKTFQINTILVPTDFSDYSKKALEKTAALVRKSENPDSKVIIQNVYQVPVGYHYTGKSFKEFSEIMKKHAQNDYQKFISKVNIKGLNLEQIYTLDKDEDIISDIYKAAKKAKADLIVIGAKGRTATTALFIGSKAERLVQMDSDVAMLVVRPKGKQAGFMEYIKEI